MNSLFRKDSRRILAVWFPFLGPERIWRQRLGRSWRSRQPQTRLPLVISHRDSNTQRIAALDEQAEALKLKPGMGIADARAMHPVDRRRRSRSGGRPPAARGLADWCDRYTPLVAIDGADGLLSRHHRLRPSVRRREGDAGRTSVAGSSDQGFDVARRPCLDAGRCLGGGAVFGLPPSSRRERRTDVWRPCRCQHFASSAATSASLESVGLRTVGRSWPRRARRLPAASARSCSCASTRRWDASRRRSRRACRSRRSRSNGISPSPSRMTEDIERLVLMLSATLKKDLERRGEGARRLQLAAVPGRRRGEPHRRRHVAADARTGADRQALP